MTKNSRTGSNEHHNENPDGGNAANPLVDYAREPAEAAYRVDLGKAGVLFGSEFTSETDLFSIRTPLPDGSEIKAPTHMMGQTADTLRLIAYDDAWGVQQQDAARFVAPGEIAIAIKHHSPAPEGGEEMKLQCTHIQIVVGIRTKDGPGVVTINNPQTYEASPFGSETYPMIFVKPVFPLEISPQMQRAYVNNIRTWLIIANTFTFFPANYDGGDPLGTRSAGQVRTLGDKLLEALAGDEAAIRWLESGENNVYCAELAHIALNLGIHYPLNVANLGTRRLRVLADQIRTKKFLARNENANVALVGLETAPDDLQPIGDLLGLQITEPNDEDPFGDGLAIEPFTMADILEQFIRRTIPRDQMGETVAPIQAALLKTAQPQLLQVTGINQLPESDPRRQAVTALYEQLIMAVGKSYRDYAAFREAIRPLLAQARKFASPRTDGAGAFVPPHCFLARASDAVQGKSCQGVFNWQYLGHGLHASVLKAM